MILWTTMLLLILRVLWLGGVSAASACDAAGPSTHLGAVTAIDLTQRVFTLKDAETAASIVFVANSDLLRALRVDDDIAVTYVTEGQHLRATSIRKN
jgi:hypothetical protein